MTAALGAALSSEGMAPLNSPCSPSFTAISCTTWRSERTASGATRCWEQVGKGTGRRESFRRGRVGAQPATLHALTIGYSATGRLYSHLAVARRPLQPCHLEPLLGHVQRVGAQLGQHARSQAAHKGLQAAGRGVCMGWVQPCLQCTTRERGVGSITQSGWCAVPNNFHDAGTACSKLWPNQLFTSLRGAAFASAGPPQPSRAPHPGTAVGLVENIVEPKLQGRVRHDLQHRHAQPAVQAAHAALTHYAARCMGGPGRQLAVVGSRAPPTLGCCTAL